MLKFTGGGELWQLLHRHNKCVAITAQTINVEYMDPHYQNLLQNGSRNPTGSAMCIQQLRDIISVGC